MRLSRLVMAVVVVMVAAPASLWAHKQESGAKTVDSGTFGIFINGRRVGSETFRIEQEREKSVATGELKVEGGTQTTHLELAANGDLLRYEWQSLSPEKSQVVVEPSSEFLVEHVLPGGNDKPLDIPFLMPHSTMVLDDNSFMQREILLWRYLAAACGSPPNEKGCALRKTDFGVLVPRQHLSMRVTLEYKGKEKVQIRGHELELDHFDLRYEDGTDWALYLDQNYKLQRIVIDADKAEIVRD